MSLGFISFLCPGLRDEKGAFAEAETCLHCMGLQWTLEAFLMEQCASSPYPSVPVSLGLSVLDCIGSSHVRNGRLLGCQELPNCLVERTPVSLWDALGLLPASLELGLVKE